MREIKVRAWDKNEEKMLYSNEEYYDYDFRCDEHGDLLCYSNCSYADTFGDEHDEWIKLDNIMQFTGLHDRAGKEAYEGDIIKGVAPDGQIISNGIICFRGCDYLVDYKEGNAQGFYYLHHILCDTMEVIGNIHDNPSLLEVQP